MVVWGVAIVNHFLERGTAVEQPTKATAHHTGKLLRAAAGIQKDSTNDERDLHARFIKWGFSMPVSIESLNHESGKKTFTTHWVRPSSWVKTLMRLYPGSLTGGFENIEDIRLQFRSFWAAYKDYHPEHGIFESPLVNQLGQVIPIALFGDEGRGPKRGQVLIWSIESVLGLDDCKPNCKCAEAMKTLPKDDVGVDSDEDDVRPCTAEFARATRQSTNNKNHSYLTRHVLFTLPHWIYKRHPEFESTHIKLMVEDLKALASEGVDVNGIRWFACVVGSKGDFKHQNLVGKLERSYNTIGVTYGNAMCSFCLAGTPGYPWERIDHNPIWSRSLFSSRPWSETPDVALLDYDSEKPEAILKLDMFHLWKVGLGRDLAGAVIVFARIGLFDGPGDPSDIKSRLIRAHSSFKLWALANHKSPGLQSFSKAYFNLKTYADSPWANAKGSDCTLLNQWLRWVAGLHLQNPTPESQRHAHMLRLFKHTADQSFAIFDVGYSHGLWLSRGCAKHLYTRLFLLLRGYRALASEVLKLKMNAWGLKPKAHAIHHVAFEIRSQLLKKNKLVMNPLCWGNEQNEDTMGRVARLSRKVATRTLTTRTLSRYFLKKRALMQRKFPKKRKR